MAQPTPTPARPLMPTEKIAEPIVEAFKFEAKRLKPTEEIVKLLAPLRFLDIVETKDALVAINVERRDIEKRPYLFSIIYLRPTEIEVVYSYVPDVSPKQRRLEIVRYLLNILSLLESGYFIAHAQFYQIIDGILARLTEYISSAYDELFSRYDAIKEEVDRTRRTIKELSEANTALAKANAEAKEQIDALKLRIAELERLSDEVLITRIQEWLIEHGYEINIPDFARLHKVSEQRVEEILNKMVREGYIAVRE